MLLSCRKMLLVMSVSMRWHQCFLFAAYWHDAGLKCSATQDTLAELGLLDFVPYLARQLCPAKQAEPCPSQAAGMLPLAGLQQLHCQQRLIRAAIHEH